MITSLSDSIGRSGKFPFLLTGEKLDLTAEKAVDLFGTDAEDGPSGTLCVTTYKICFKFDTPSLPLLGEECLEIPLGSILKYDKESRAAARGLSVVSLTTRDLRTESFGVPATMAKDLLALLKKRTNPQSTSATFASSNKETFGSDGWQQYEAEFDRQGLPWEHWVIAPVNEGYYLCDSYPRGLPIPNEMRGADLSPISQFRSRGRVQVLSWYSRTTDTVLCRCAQLNPIVVQDMVGMASIKCPEDQRMMSAIRKSTRAGSRLVVPEGPPVSGGIGKGALWVLDTGVRPTTQQAWTDQQSHYPDCEYEFLGLPPSAVVREAMNRLHTTCTTIPSTDARFRTQLEELRHLEALGALLHAANAVAGHLDSGDSVVVQSPDGGDAAAQLCSLAQMFIDPFYRTIKGFQILIEKEWLGFGYRFVLEKKASGKQQEVMSSVFTQWIDCVWQVWQQFPSAFEFNEAYLLAILDHVYSYRFGTFIYGTEKERLSEKLATTTPSLWGFLNANTAAFANPFYVISRTLSASASPSLSISTSTSSSARPASPGSLPSATLVPLDTAGALKFWSGLYARHLGRAALRRARAALATNADTLELDGMGLAVLPPEMISAKSLTRLHAPRNLISTLPLHLAGTFTALRSLDLEANWLAALAPSYFSLLAPRLAVLEELNLSGNGLTRVPDELTQLTGIRVLRLADNRLERLPNVRVLTALVELNVAGNVLADPFPRDVLVLEHLRCLEFANNRFSSLPDELSRLTRLTALGFGGNPLLRLPDIQRLTALRSLNLESTSVTTIPPAIWDLTLLERLYLGGLNLTELPAELGRLSALQYLSLRNNALNRLPTELLCSLAQLRYLDVDHNKLASLPLEVGQLTALTFLNLANNVLEAVSPAVGKLTGLRVLNLSHNQRLEMLPPALGFLPLSELNLDGLRLKTPSKDIVMEGRAAVLAYLRDLLQGAEPCNRMKLMLVGQENVGKTSVLRCLMRRYKGAPGAKKYDISTISTDGIAIDGWNFQWAGTDGKAPRQDFTISAWDFAGQEIYYSTHQFFLSERSIYLVVWNLARPEAESRVEFWLQSIQARARGAQILIVGTHLDDRVCSKDYIKSTIAALERKYKRRFPNIKAIHPVSCASGKGIDKLRSDVEMLAAKHESAGTLVPRSYAGLESLVLEERRKRQCPVASFAEFASMAAMNAITDDISVRNAAVLLHNLGSIVHFEKDAALRDLIILDPQWLTDVMSSVLTTKHTFGKDGRLRLNALGQIWREPRFPAALHPTLLHLLEKFEVFLRLNAPGEEPIYLIPYMLSEERPASLDQSWTPLSAGESCFGRRYQFDFVPRGLFGRIVVRVLRLVDPRLFWQHGLVVTRGTERLLLELDPVTKTLDLQARGRTGEALELAVGILDTIESLVNDWYRIARHVFVFCTHCLENHVASPFMFPLELLTSAAMQGRATVTCSTDKHASPVSLARLVPDVALALAASKRLDYNSLNVISEIGEGAFATVYKATLDGELVAVKRLKVGQAAGISDVSPLKAFEEFRREIWIMGSLQHPNILPLRGYTLEPCAMVTEFLEGGDLHELLQDKNRVLEWPARILIARDIASGMAYLHGRSPPVLHRDLKSPNVLLASVDGRLCAKVADFGVAQAIASRGATGRVVQNPTWLAPEIMRGEEYTLQSDMYSFGIIAWEIASRAIFFGECKFLSQVEEAVLAGKRAAFPADTPEWFKRLTEAAWSGTPSQRPAFVDIRDLLSARSAPATSATPATTSATPGAPPTESPSSSRKTGTDLDGSAHKRDPKSKKDKREKKEKKEKKHRSSKHHTPATPSTAPTVASVSPKVTPSKEPPPVASPRVPVVVAPKEEPVVDVKLEASADDDRLGKRDGAKASPPALLSKPKLPAGAALTAIGRVEHRLWLGGADGRLQLMDMASEKVVETRTGHRGAVSSIAHVHSAVWTAAADGLRVWDASSAKPTHHIPCSFSPAHLLRVGKTVWCGVRTEVIIYEATSYQLLRTLSLDLGPIAGLVLVGSSVWIALGRVLAKIDARTQTVVSYLQGHTLPINSLSTSGAELSTAADDGTVRVWNAKSGQCLRQLEGHTGAVRSVCLDGHFTWSAGIDRQLLAWDNTGSCVRDTQDREAATSALLVVESDAFKEIRTYAGGADGSLLVYGVRVARP